MMSILAGGAVALAGRLYAGMDNKLAAAILFSFALYMVCLFGLDLFTGKIGFLTDRTRPVLWYGQIFLGNFIGAAGISLLCLAADPGIQEIASGMIDAKLDIPLWSLFARGMLCGFLMYIAVVSWKKTGSPLGIFLCIPMFILSGFEHSIADMSYMVMGLRFDFLGALLVIALGNAAGSILLHFLKNGIMKPTDR
ncbi:formate/nitrite transporter family protein [uncultured Faecalibaculum sp.]|uniref:formate/nitrite transporter family protein n=1 Tax=uncultured Faecalibaculum sp. TaxID=1729681 RepID=UPI002611ECF9|nr:formate/nitrite transporter family protein [uncultured Faecalibaculum sp.]